MRIGRYLNHEGRPSLGRFECEDDEWFVTPLVGDFFSELEAIGERAPLDGLRLLPPILPSKIVGIGSNYRAHIAEMGRAEPLVPKVFLKPSTAVVGPMEAIQIPPETIRVDHEAELALVIGRRASRVSEADAMNYLLGMTCINDVTARDFQKQDGTFARGKGFDTFAPIGPWIVKTQSPEPRRVCCWVNDELRQEGNTSDLLFELPKLISFVSHVMTLLPGDIIATGTPSGVAPLHDGDRVVVEVEGIGQLVNPVINREDRVDAS
jgi:2-keto-4-pentenoate hydratase/2-oxohepta-3-ene-1,7-dioic acid hydratase in catechol pathway